MFDWNSTISNDGEAMEYILLPEGDYDFTVTGFEKSEHPGSAKIPPCPKAVLELTIKTASGIGTVRENLYLEEGSEWKLCAYFKCIGMRSHGEKYTMNWDKVLGAKGRAHIIVDTWEGTDGVTRQNNKVKKYLDAPAPFSFG